MAAIADFELLGEGITYANPWFSVKYSIPDAIRQRLSPPQQLFLMPDALLETIRARFDSVINGSAAGGGLDPGDPLDADQIISGMDMAYTQTFRNDKYLVFIKKQNNVHLIHVSRWTEPEEQQAVRPVFESVVNGLLQQLAASVPPTAGGRRRKTRKQRRRMSRRRVR